MATITELTTYLAELKAARTALLTGKSYQIGDRQLTRVDERWLSAQISETEAQISLRRRGNSVEPRFLNGRG